jgi:hypothetical protein
LPSGMIFADEIFIYNVWMTVWESQLNVIVENLTPEAMEYLEY